MSTEENRRRLRRLVPSWSFLTRLRRPYLFSRKRKDRGEKSAWGCGVLSASEFRREPGLQASFHSGVTLRAFDYAPPDTEVSDLQLVAVERLLSIEGALEIQMNFAFLRGPCRGGALLRPFFRRDRHPRTEQSPAPTERAQRLPFQGSWRRRRLRGCLFPARPLRLGFAEPPPLSGEALDCVRVILPR